MLLTTHCTLLKQLEEKFILLKDVGTNFATDT